jgi:2-methylcitrate dehydratase PrpD
VFLDAVGEMLAGNQLPNVSLLASRVGESGRPGEQATCPGLETKYSPASAAMINGVAGSSLEFDEGNSWARGHPAIQVLPAVAATCESVGLSGFRLLEGLLCGYEAAARIGRAVSLRRGLHPTGTWGVAAAALAVGKVLGRTAEDLLEIANLAASYAFSPYVRNSFAGHSAAATFAGVTNQLGMLANRLFESGFRADPESFGMTFSRFVSEELRADILSTDLGRDYAIEQGYLKPYPACRFTHPALDALSEILRTAPIVPEQVSTIEVKTFDAAAHGSDRQPTNAEAMRFSVPYLLSALVCRGRIGVETVSEETRLDPVVQRLAGKVSVSAVPEYESLRPGHNAARVDVTLADGKVLSQEVTDCRGDPAQPLTDREVADKFRGLAEPVLGAEATQEFMERAWHLEGETDVRSLFERLRPSA